MKLTQEQITLIEEALDKGNSVRGIARDVLGKESRESTIRYGIKNGIIGGEVTEEEGAKVLFLDVEVSASIVAAFSMFKHFSTPDHIVQFPYMLTYAVNWLHENPEKLHTGKLDDYEEFKEDHTSDYQLVNSLWYYLDACDICIIHNESFDTGWFNQRCAYWGLPQPSPYRIICTLKGLKKAMSLPSNSLDYSTKYFNLGHTKLHHEGISLWIKCMDGDTDALSDMLAYNRGDLPTLRELYLKIRAYIPNHPNISLYYGDDVTRCSVCGSTNLEELSGYAYTNLSKFKSHRCNDCGTVKREGKSVTTADQRRSYLRIITK